MGDVILKSVCKSFGSANILKGIDLNIKDGEFIVFVGPSGCGKSTLLRTIAGLETATSGEIYISGKMVNDVPAAQRGVAMVFQSYALYPHMTVRENIAFGLTLQKMPKKDIEDRVAEAARILHIDLLLDKKPSQLSGGQRQRVAIGRAITRHPEVFLFDEPLSNLDAALRTTMRIELSKLHKDLASTMIYVTHDQVEAMTLADKIVVLHGGIVEQVGTPMELYRRPENKFVAGFIGSPKMNFLQVQVKDSKHGELTLELPGGNDITVDVDRHELSIGNTATLGVRPEHIWVSTTEGDATLTGRVTVTEQLGGDTFIHMDLGNEAIVVRADGQVYAEPGETVTVSIKADSIHLFDKNDKAIFCRHHEEKEDTAA